LEALKSEKFGKAIVVFWHDTLKVKWVIAQKYMYAVRTMYRVGHAIHTCTILMEHVVDSNGTNME